ncbi:SIS domain-containing protein [Bacteroides sp.]|uniref:SIS domain-containing protein n=1 Tax=Bacteroides sp. TaxID=29523 RepID=UPI002FCA899D
MNKFIEEIEEQPEALKRALLFYCSEEGKKSLKVVSALWKSGKYDKILFTGMGSSYFISQAAAIFTSEANVPALAVNAGELLHSQSPAWAKETLLIAISQSGESYEVIELLKKQSCSLLTVIGITNEPDSSLAAMATHTLLCKAGKEDMTSTKSFITTYLVVYLLAELMKGNEADDRNLEEIMKEVGRQLTERDAYLSRSLTFLRGHHFVQVIGRGATFATAAQTALMFMEATKTPASALLGGEFRHGPLEMVDSTFICIIYAHSQSGVYKQMLKLVADILIFKGRVIWVSDVDSGIHSPDLMEIHVRCGNSNLFAIPAIIPVQLMVNAWAGEKNLVPGSFTHGAKVTTIE